MTRGDQHPTPEELVACADGDTAGVDLAAVGRHVAACPTCREAVAALTEMRGLMERAAAERGLPPAPNAWAALSAGMAELDRRRARTRWALGLMAASLAGLVALAGIRGRGDAGGTPELGDLNAAAAAESDAALVLSQAVAEGRSRLPSSEQAAMDAVLASIEEAVRHTEAALEADPSNDWLRSHLGELHRKRVSALQDYVSLIRDHG